MGETLAAQTTGNSNCVFYAEEKLEIVYLNISRKILRKFDSLKLSNALFNVKTNAQKPAITKVTTFSDDRVSLTHREVFAEYKFKAEPKSYTEVRN